MNNLETDLNAIPASTPLNVSIDDVFARGDRMRARRRRRIGLGVASGTAVAAVAVTAALPTGTPIGPQDAAAAAWGPRAVNLTETELATTRELCAADTGLALPSHPVVADKRSDTTALVYHSGAVWVDCLVQDRDSGPVVDSWGKHDPGNVPEGREFGLLNLQWSEKTGDSSRIEDGVVVARVASDVARLIARIDGGTYRAEVEGGLAVFWLPGGAAVSQIDSADIEAFDRAGREIDSSSIADVPFVD